MLHRFVGTNQVSRQAFYFLIFQSDISAWFHLLISKLVKNGKSATDIFRFLLVKGYCAVPGFFIILFSSHLTVMKFKLYYTRFLFSVIKDEILHH